MNQHPSLRNRLIGAVSVVSSVALVTGVLSGVPSSAEPAEGPTGATATEGLVCVFGPVVPIGNVSSVMAVDDKVYASSLDDPQNAISGGVHISTNGGSSYTTYTQGLASTNVQEVFAKRPASWELSNTVYAATDGGLGISDEDEGKTYTTVSTKEGRKGSNEVYSVFAEDTMVYAGTLNGLSTSWNWGVNGSFSVNTLTDSGALVSSVFAQGDIVYAATIKYGLWISTDRGETFTQRTIATGLGSYVTNDVFAQGDTVYVATAKGLSISTNGGSSFTNYTTANGLATNNTYSVFAQGSTVYAATNGGLSISTDGGMSFTTYTPEVFGGANTADVYAQGDTVYVGTTAGVSVGTCSTPIFPAVSSMVPAAGGVAGGTPVVIRGTDLDLVESVSFGTGGGSVVEADAFASQSATQIALLTPPDVDTAGGVVTVSLGYASISGQESTVTVPGGFTYLTGVVVKGVAPEQGGMAGGTRVTLGGAGLSAVSEVLFGGVGASIVQQTDSVMVVQSPAADAAGAVEVEVVYPQEPAPDAQTSVTQFSSSGPGSAASARFGASVSPVVAEFEYQPPAVTGISPPGGVTAGGTQVTISGSYLGSVTGVTFGGVPGTDLVVAEDQVTVTSPPGSPGAVTVAVQYPGGGVLPMQQAFTYAAVALGGVSPTRGPLAGGTRVVIQGPGIGAVSSVLFGSQPGTITATGIGWLTVTSPSGTNAGPVDITVSGDGAQEVLPDAFTYDAAPCPSPSISASPSSSSSASSSADPCVSPSPTVSLTYPAEGPVGSSLYIIGTNLDDATVTVGGVGATVMSDSTSGSLDVVVPNIAVGAQTIVVSNAGGAIVLPGAFTVTAPKPSPTASPTVSPTARPTWWPTSTPSPSITPTRFPTRRPSPTASPTVSPTASPTASPSVSPTASPTPTVSPSAGPTASPAASPSVSPTPTVTSPPPPPSLEYAVPKVTGVPCPPGWGSSWQAWANGPVCEVTESYDSSTDSYPQTYAQASIEGRIYEQAGMKLARVVANPKVGQAVRTHGKAWVTTATQKVYFPADGASLSDRDALIAERLVAALQADNLASVRLTGYGSDASTRNARVIAVKKYLMAAGIDASRVLTQVGSTAGDRVSAAVLHQLGTGPRLTTG